ncbi:hypothetical protein B0H14DRAFT_2632397 [Mycena olivaceomarginata]|nr:hypothetical protein B0H14DRAFT_2632397 [Mycena olivaceomarginata]
MSSSSQPTSECNPFVFFNTPSGYVVGADALDGPGDIDFNLPPYRLTDADVVPTPGRPLLTISPSECGPSRVQTEGDSWPPFYFFSHPAIYRLMPFVWIPARIWHTNPAYLATILDRAVPVFEIIRHSYALIPHSRAQKVVLAGLLKLVSEVSQIIPARVQSGWTAFFPEDEPATSPTWDTYPTLSRIWLFPGTEEFPMDQPLRDPLSVADHSTLLCIAQPNLRVLVHFIARNRIREGNGPQMAVSLLNDALAPEYPIFELLIDEFRAGCLSPTITHIIFNSVRSLIASLPSEMRNPVWLDHLLPESPDHASTFANRVLAPSLVIPRLPHEDLSSEPYPVMDMSDYDPMWYWWRRIQDERPSASSTLDARAESTSPHYRPTTPPEPSPLSTPGSPSTPPGPSAVGSASFDIRSLRPSSIRSSPSKPKASADARSPSPLPEMEVDPQEISPEDAQAIAEAITADIPCPARSTMRGGKTTRGRAPPAQFSSVPDIDPKGRPMIRVRSSRKSSTPPTEEAYNEEGEEEKDDNEEEEEEEESPRPAKRQRTGPATSKGRASGKGKGKGKARATTPAPVDTSTRCPIPVRKTCGKSKKGELPAYVPPQPVPPMDTISLAAETLASQRREPLVFDAGCSNCILRDRKCDHGAPRSLCEHCDKGCLSHCSHTFAVADHARAANHLEPYTRLSNERGNELITDLSAARADYELAREQLFLASARIAVASNRVSAWIRSVVTNLGPYGLPQITEIPEDLRPLWGQLLLEAEAELSVDYRAAIMRYPFISDPRRNNLPTDEDLPTLIEFLTRRAARAHQPTPPPEEGSNWPEEDGAGPSGSK